MICFMRYIFTNLFKTIGLCLTHQFIGIFAIVHNIVIVQIVHIVIVYVISHYLHHFTQISCLFQSFFVRLLVGSFATLKSPYLSNSSCFRTS